MALNIVMGVSGSGKTYFSNKYFPGWEHFSVGEYQARLAEEARNDKSRELYYHREVLIKANEEIKQDVIKALEEGRDVVMEHTLYKAKRRITYMEAFRKVTDTPINIYVMSPSDEQLRKNLEASGYLEDNFEYLKEEMAQIELPNIVEGYTQMFVVRDDVVEEYVTERDDSIINRAKEELAVEEAQKKDALKKQELIKEMEEKGFWHYCEVCGVKKLLTPGQAYDEGWDYPPKMGAYGVISPRTCGNCGIDGTIWWKMHMAKESGFSIENLSEQEKKTFKRILSEPYSLLKEEGDE